MKAVRRDFERGRSARAGRTDMEKALLMKTLLKDVRDFCDATGSGFTPRVIDYEQVAYLEFENGMNIEVSGISSKRGNRVSAYLWSKPHVGAVLLAEIHDIPQEDFTRNPGLYIDMLRQQQGARFLR